MGNCCSQSNTQNTAFTQPITSSGSAQNTKSKNKKNKTDPTDTEGSDNDEVLFDANGTRIVEDPSRSSKTEDSGSFSYNSSSAIVTSFGIAVGIELNDIAGFLNNISKKDVHRKETVESSSFKNAANGMDYIWEGCLGKNKSYNATITNNEGLTKLLYKLTYITLNAQKNKNSGKQNKTKPDHKSVQSALVPLKQAILEQKYNKQFNTNQKDNNISNEILAAEFEVTREDFIKSFSKYLTRASELLQQN